MTVTQGPDACHIASLVAPSFQTLPDPRLFLPDLPLPCIPPGLWWSSVPHDQQAWQAQGPGEGISLMPMGHPTACFAGFVSGVLIIAAPGGIVPFYYTVDLYLIRHHLKPSALSWHPHAPRIPPASVCPLL